MIGDSGGALVLTAAHCLRNPIAGAAIGADYAEPDVFLPTLSQFAHQAYVPNSISKGAGCTWRLELIGGGCDSRYYAWKYGHAAVE